MRIAILLASTMALLSGCKEQNAGPLEANSARGRYAGIGVYQAGRMWGHMVAPDPKDSTLARIADDEYVIAVVDSRTGEVRQCGDHSGHCVAMNPWAGPPPPALPAKLAAHAKELDAQEKIETEPVSNETLTDLEGAPAKARK